MRKRFPNKLREGGWSRGERARAGVGGGLAGRQRSISCERDPTGFAWLSRSDTLEPPAAEQPSGPQMICIRTIRTGPRELAGREIAVRVLDEIGLGESSYGAGREQVWSRIRARRKAVRERKKRDWRWLDSGKEFLKSGRCV